MKSESIVACYSGRYIQYYSHKVDSLESDKIRAIIPILLLLALDTLRADLIDTFIIYNIVLSGTVRRYFCHYVTTTETGAETVSVDCHQGDRDH